MLSRFTVRQRVIAGSALFLVVAALCMWAAWSEAEKPPPPRERQYKAVTACLLTDDKDLGGDLARAAWAGMQDASVATLVKVQHLAIVGPQTADNGLSFYNTLGVQQCTVIIAAGDVPVAAMVLGLASFPQVRQVTIGGDPAGRPVTAVDASTPATISAGVKAVVASAA